jgi:aspartyl-tRNA synthetase
MAEHSDRVLIGELGEHVGETVSIDGWVDVRRDQGKLVFFDFRDRTGYVQGVVLPSKEVDGEALMEKAKEVRNEFVVRITGIVNQRPEKNVQTEKQNGNIELEIKGIEILAATEPLPFELDAELNLDTYLDNLPFMLRSARARAIFKVQSEIVRAYRAF